MEFKQYNFDTSKKVSIHDINLPTEVKDYVLNICEVDEITFETYPKELLNQGLIFSIHINSDFENYIIESQSFNLYEKIEYTFFNQTITLYGIAEENKPSYIVSKKLNINSVIVIKINGL